MGLVMVITETRNNLILFNKPGDPGGALPPEGDPGGALPPDGDPGGALPSDGDPGGALPPGQQLGDKGGPYFNF